MGGGGIEFISARFDRMLSCNLYSSECYGQETQNEQISALLTVCYQSLDIAPSPLVHRLFMTLQQNAYKLHLFYSNTQHDNKIEDILCQKRLLLVFWYTKRTLKILNVCSDIKMSVKSGSTFCKSIKHGEGGGGRDKV